MTWKPSMLPYPVEYETRAVLKKLASAHRALAELKGVAQSIPRPEILINTLALQEAKDSSEVENIVTTHDELFKSSLGLELWTTPASKEVQNYAAALGRGFQLVVGNKFITTNNILEIQGVLEANQAGLRRVPGTTLKDESGRVVYIPPQDAREIKELMDNLELFLNDTISIDLDPLVKMAVVHFQFESIHPFYDGNGRTGRIINILYLVMHDLLDLPILYLSRYIIRNKAAYYALLQGVRERGDWEAWILYLLDAVEVTSADTVRLIHALKKEMQEMKFLLRDSYKFYSQELLNHLFRHPYTKIEFLREELSISRLTASAYLNQLADDGVLLKYRLGKTNYYVNTRLMDVLMHHS
jgi:Fic family protein